MDEAIDISAPRAAEGCIGEPAFWWPEWIPISAWHEHIPFAFWLISAARPRSFVELGTHFGASYCAFCQAIDRLGIGSRATAVDTWRGDQQSGFYGDEVLQQLQVHHDQRYGRFSRLLRSTFDEALSHFDDQSIDLLHIDGLHNYEAVRHDFEAWLPKMSPSGVVLFHDTSEHDFGVARLWNEISASRPHFLFEHGHGLGVIAVGSDVPRALQHLFACGADPAQGDIVRTVYVRLGRAISDFYQLTQTAEAAAIERTRLNTALDNAETALSEAVRLRGDVEAERSRLAKAHSEAQVSLRGVQAELEDLRASNAALRAKPAQSEQKIEEANARAEAATMERDRVSIDLREATRASWARRLAQFLFLGELNRQRRKKRRQKREIAFITDRKLIDPEWYLTAYPDVAASGMDPVLHYVFHGACEGRAPHPGFDSAGYLNKYQDVARLGLNPLVHFERYGRAEGRSPTGLDGPNSGRNSAGSYAVWQARFDYDPTRDRGTIASPVAQLRRRPTISVLMPVYNPKPRDLEDAIHSVERQIYRDWELCIADDASTDPRVRAVLEAAVARDGRIKIVYRPVNGHIAEASNSALALVTGEYVALLDHDDLLREHALAEVAFVIEDHPDAELIYSDEDKLDDDGRRYEPYFKPDFSRELFRSQNYLNHLTVHRTEGIRAVGGWRPGFEGSQDYDLNLRVFERVGSGKIRHIPKVLYHWRAARGSTARAGSEKSYAFAAGLKALEEHVKRTGLNATVSPAPSVPFYRIQHTVPDPHPLVSLIVPTRDNVPFLRRCISSILHKTTYDNYEIIVVDNGSIEKKTLVYFETLKQNVRVRILHYDMPFNYSAINNFAVSLAKGDVVGLINNDIEVISPDWLTEMVSWAIQPDIGCVGAKLYYADDTIQHAGVILGIGGVAGHSHKAFPRNHPGYFCRLKIVQNLSAVTAACLLVRKNVYEKVDGMNAEDLKVAFNDVDLCLRIREAGYLNVWTPHAELYHYESASRGSDNDPKKRARFYAETEYMKRRWSAELASDPFYSSNLSVGREDFSIST